MANVCSSQGVWKNTDSKVVHAALWLANRGKDIAGLSDEDVLSEYQNELYPILPDVYDVNDQEISIRQAGERR